MNNGRRIRVLGIDSCESNTVEGTDATRTASAIQGTTIQLLKEPGIELDPYGRELRYVTMADGRDFGEWMISYPHTGIYEGGGASASRMAALRAADVGGRTCGPRPGSVPYVTPPPPIAQAPLGAPAPRPERPSPKPRAAPKPRPVPKPEPAPKAKSSGSSDHYTGPRCYAPGGKTYRPC